MSEDVREATTGELLEEIERLQENYVGVVEFYKSLLRKANIGFQAYEEPWYEDAIARIVERNRMPRPASG
jgi:hypothetical protein